MISKGDKTVLINSMEFKNRLSELRSENPEISNIELAKILSDEYNANILPQNIKNLTNSELSLELTREGSAEKNLKPFLKSIEKRFSNLEKTTDKYHSVVNRVVDKLSEMDDVDLIDNIKDVLGVGKQVDVVSKMLLAQIEIVQAETDKLKMTATNGMIKVDDAIKDVDKYFIDLLKTLAEQRKITINDERLIKQTLGVNKEVNRIYTKGNITNISNKQIIDVEEDL